MKEYGIELGRAGRILIEDIIKAREGETVVITCDSCSDENVVEAAARAVYSCGAIPMVIIVTAGDGVGKAVDPYLPLDSLEAALKKADVWVEFNRQWLLYSTPFENAMAENKNLRYLCLVGMDSDMMVRVIDRVDNKKLIKFLNKIAERTKQANRIRVTTPSGTELEFNNSSKHPINIEEGDASSAGIHMLPGQISWAPDLESINGKLVFDGSLYPPIGLLNSQVNLIVEQGRIKEISGGSEANEFRQWLSSFSSDEMYRLAHISYGFNPGAKLTGNILEDERVWGCTEWGLGYLSSVDAPPHGIKAPSHTDGICLNSSVWLDGEKIMENGQVIDKELKKYLKGLL